MKKTPHNGDETIEPMQKIQQKRITPPSILGAATIPPHEQFRVGPGNATLKPRLYSRVGEYQVLVRSPIR